MGQYFMPCVLKKNWKLVKSTSPILDTIYPRAFFNGSKLTEHSFVGNKVVEEAVNMLSPTNYGGYPFVWTGDYNNDFKFNNPFDKTCKEKDNLYHIAMAQYDEKPHKLIETDRIFGRYIINLSKKQYVVVLPNFRERVLIYHPLPLLCAAGNGQGCGDYLYEEEEDKIGMWAYDKILCSDNVKDIPKGFKHIRLKFKVEKF